MPTYRLLIEYEGTKFAGWQVQASGRTVQGVLLDTLRTITGERGLDLQGAGRTDAGVHALGQVASLRCRAPLNSGKLFHALERELPADLAVLDVRPAPRGFHARHDAVARAYRYQIATRRSAFGKRSSWWVEGALDEAAMRRGGAPVRRAPRLPRLRQARGRGREHARRGGGDRGRRRPRVRAAAASSPATSCGTRCAGWSGRW